MLRNKPSTIAMSRVCGSSS